jgi:hypothetical protein
MGHPQGLRPVRQGVYRNGGILQGKVGMDMEVDKTAHSSMLPQRGLFFNPSGAFPRFRIALPGRQNHGKNGAMVALKTALKYPQKVSF